ncbi:hypothetical protein H6P81_009790 [Aristolochia fimbriata]|uniref:DUF220 domain-containing protein n=1 Tax=Aristolochia fimbriata TaxID=158543 RepID=A0AAV7ELZ7_ARIFI|nr:hypothetical protein H6P81_009790 [Aristolochia fimbriata]
MKASDFQESGRSGPPPLFRPAIDFLLQIPLRLQNCLKSKFKEPAFSFRKLDAESSSLSKEKRPGTTLNVSLEQQLQRWHDNPYWIDQPPEIKVTVPEGSLCSLNVRFKIGLPPDAVYNIVIDPENKRVFKNIKEVISRRVLLDEGLRQVVEVEQAAIWRFLWFSGTISVHVLVDQNRADHSVIFKQGKAGFMRRFEGCWKLEPLFVDEQSCHPHKPVSFADYDSCTEGKGRVGTLVNLEQLVEPALLPPPPFSWYLRGITTKTTEMLITDLLAETARIRGNNRTLSFTEERGKCNGLFKENGILEVDDIKSRWKRRRSHRERRNLSKPL